MRSGILFGKIQPTLESMNHPVDYCSLSDRQANAGSISSTP
jgi:hypothetical protein